MTENEPRIFLCHAKEDKPQVIELYHQLKEAGYHPWLDEEDLLPGVDWELEIRRAIRGSEIFLACLSQKSLTRKGYIHKEIKLALDELDQMPEDKIYLIPVRLEDCTVPDRLQARQWVDLFEPRGFEKLMRALDAELGPRQASFEPELILIPAGEFLMGSDPTKDAMAPMSEQPQHTIYLPDYYIAKTPVTNAEYAAFVQATLHEPPDKWPKAPEPPLGKEKHPVSGVNWHDAMAYCQWLADTTGKAYRLPSEAEWEKAARGTDGRIYPWGDEWDPKRCNTYESMLRDTTPVGLYSPQGDSPYGCADMAGNVLEWTRSLWGKDGYEPEFNYPYDPADGRENLEADETIRRVVRGGSWGIKYYGARCALRLKDERRWILGFRVCVAAQQG